MIQFRFAQISDAAALADVQVRAVEQKLFGKPYNQKQRKKELQQAKLIILSTLNLSTDKNMDNNIENTQIIVASYNQKPVGYIMYDFEDSALYVHEIYTADPKALHHDRKLHVGEKLVKKMMGFKQGVTQVNLSAVSKSIKFHRKMGLELVSSKQTKTDDNAVALAAKKSPQNAKPEYPKNNKDDYHKPIGKLNYMGMTRRNIDMWHVVAVRRHPKFTAW